MFRIAKSFLVLSSHQCFQSFSRFPAKHFSNIVEKDDKFRKYFKGQTYEPVDVETSIEYLKSESFEKTYLGKPVWHFYRRNQKGHFPKKYTKKSCVIGGVLTTANPCPMCRDNHLVLDYRNKSLLEHFINSNSGEVFPSSKTGICQRQQKRLMIEYGKAVDMGTIKTKFPFVLYDYSEYLDSNDIKELEGWKIFQSVKYDHDAYKLIKDDKLPIDLLNLLLKNVMINHAQRFSVETDFVDVERPKIPSRYKIEEDYKKLLLARKRAKSVISI